MHPQIFMGQFHHNDPAHTELNVETAMNQSMGQSSIRQLRNVETRVSCDQHSELSFEMGNT